MQGPYLASLSSGERVGTGVGEGEGSRLGSTREGVGSGDAAAIEAALLLLGKRVKVKPAAAISNIPEKVMSKTCLGIDCIREVYGGVSLFYKRDGTIYGYWQGSSVG